MGAGVHRDCSLYRGRFQPTTRLHPGCSSCKYLDMLALQVIRGVGVGGARVAIVAESDTEQPRLL